MHSDVVLTGDTVQAVNATFTSDRVREPLGLPSCLSANDCLRAKLDTAQGQTLPDNAKQQGQHGVHQR